MRAARSIWEIAGRIDTFWGRLKVLWFAFALIGGAVLAIWALALSRFGVLGTAVLLVGLCSFLLGVAGLLEHVRGSRRSRKPPEWRDREARMGPKQRAYLEALEREREGYVRRGLRDRTKQVDDQIRKARDEWWEAEGVALDLEHRAGCPQKPARTETYTQTDPAGVEVEVAHCLDCGVLAYRRGSEPASGRTAADTRAKYVEREPAPRERLAWMIREGQNLRDMYVDAFGRRQVPETTDDDLRDGVREWTRQAAELVDHHFASWSNLFHADARLLGTDAANVREYMNGRISELEIVQVRAATNGAQERVPSPPTPPEEDEEDETPESRSRVIVMRDRVELRVRAGSFLHPVARVRCEVTHPNGTTYRANALPTAPPQTGVMAVLGGFGARWAVLQYPIEFDHAPRELDPGLYRVRWIVPQPFGFFDSEVFDAFRI